MKISIDGDIAIKLGIEVEYNTPNVYEFYVDISVKDPLNFILENRFQPYYNGKILSSEITQEEVNTTCVVGSELNEDSCICGSDKTNQPVWKVAITVAYPKWSQIVDVPEETVMELLDSPDYQHNDKKHPGEMHYFITYRRGGI